MSTLHERPATADINTRPVTWLASFALLGALALLGLAAFFTYMTATYVPEPGGDESLAGLGYVMAVIVAVPGVFAALLAGLGLFLRVRAPRAALTLAVFAFGSIALIALGGSFLFLPTLSM
ncbi:hypothetical protein GCM10027020_30430 [Nocardioides salsibiostraticola]